MKSIIKALVVALFVLFGAAVQAQDKSTPLPTVTPPPPTPVVQGDFRAIGAFDITLSEGTIVDDIGIEYPLYWVARLVITQGSVTPDGYTSMSGYVDGLPDAQIWVGTDPNNRNYLNISISIPMGSLGVMSKNYYIGCDMRWDNAGNLRGRASGSLQLTGNNSYHELEVLGGRAVAKREAFSPPPLPCINCKGTQSK